MKTVNIGDLKNGLSGYLQFVRDGEEIIVRDRSVPVARILPFRRDAGWEEESHLIASGALKMPEHSMDWDQFFLLPAGSVAQGTAIEAVQESRGDR